MMRFKIILLILLTGLQGLYAQDYFNKKENQNRRHLVIVHPTRSNLERYSFLIDEGILDPGNLKLVGLYFEAEEYDYDNIIEDFPDFGFHEIPGKISLKDIFRENSASDEFNKVFKYSKGIIFNGGPDIPPAIYGEEMSTLTIVKDPYRHYYEVSFLFHLLGSSRNEDFKPLMRKRPIYSVLGICLGMQTMNVATGGDLIQDIPSEVYNMNFIERIVEMDPDLQHRNYFNNLSLFPEIRSYFLHSIKILPGRWLDNEIDNTINLTPSVFSSHHQAVDKPGKDFRIAATSMDGKIIEAIEHTRYPNVFGIQFHPEVDYLYQDEKKYKFLPYGEDFSLRDKLIEKNSMDFHLQFWRAFSNTL
ncbi:MAG: gamma-glutamyl-gamma-aminobutyrate hydrolase family protein [Bacteroidales bacterium]